ncbi:sulfatase [Bacteroidales bacterium]|nr:sulfatase [Bacteroidales bacterium]
MTRLYIFLISLLSTVGCHVHQSNPKKPNILFIGIDDLRPELGCYGSAIAQSPNIDNLASKGILFNRAYCQQAICGPSRASLMTGIRPLNSGITHNYIRFRDSLPETYTISQYFGTNGYRTSSIGKIFHHGDNDSLSWNSEVIKDSIIIANELKVSGFALPINIQNRKVTRKKMFAKYGKIARFGLAMGPAYECADVSDNRYIDGHNTDIAINTLKDMAADDSKPFFMAVGYNKPHLNWVAPKKYWDLYNREKMQLARHENRPKNSTAMGLHPSFELRVRSGIPKIGTIDTSLSKTLLHSYLACISYVDAQIGKLINTLEELDLMDNTIIVLWSDHGYHLGEMGIWGKASNYEIATRVPLIINTPDMDDEIKGSQTNALVELLDIFPTLCDAAGLTIPEHLDGTSLLPIISNTQSKWKTAVYSQFPTPALREWGAFPLRPAMRETYFGPLIEEMEKKIKKEQQEKWIKEVFENYVMGYAMRTDRYRLIAWIDESKTIENPLAIELFDHQLDPYETQNIANDNSELVRLLLSQMKKDLQLNF